MAFTIESVVSFCNEMKCCYSTQLDVYHQFMDAVQQYASEKIEIHEMLNKMSRILDGRPDLKHRFTQLLPPGMQLENFMEVCSEENLVSVDVLIDLPPMSALDVHIGMPARGSSQSSSNCLHGYFTKLLNMKLDWNLADAAKYGTFKEFAFFTKVRQLVGNEETYLNFLRCMSLYTNDLLTACELADTVQTFLFKKPELTKELRMLLSCDHPQTELCFLKSTQFKKSSISMMEIDYASCKKHGTSYRALPACYQQPVCTGRTLPGNELCNEVLNDIWVSFPLWSEDSTFGNSKISQFEEFMYRCEDERFELDIVIDNIAAAVVALEAVQSNINKMTVEEASTFQLDSNLGGTSETLQRKSIERIYGDKAIDMIEGLIKKPCVAVPIVLRRLRTKLDEWRDAQKRYNQLWHDQCEKNHSKWLQSQAASFRQLDSRQMRSKTLLNEAETASEELQVCGDCSPGCCLEFIFTDKQDMCDAIALIIHYLSYLPSGQTDDSFRVSQFLLNTLPQLIDVPSVSEPHSGATHRHEGEVYTLMYANSSWYLFLRLYHIFCVRLKVIQRIANGLQQDGHGPQLDSLNGVKSYYEFVLNTVRGMIEGTVDLLSYENELRKVLGTSAYIAFTIEKVLQNIVRQLQHLTSDDVCKELMTLYQNERQRGGSGGSFSTAYQRQFAELAYRRKVVQLLADEYCFKIVFFRYECRIVMELIDVESEMAADDQLLMQYHASSYVQQFIEPHKSFCEEFGVMKPVFLMRNIQSQEPEDLSTLSVIDNVHCHFAPNTFKMSFVANSFSFLYRPWSLLHSRQRNRSLSLIKHQKFSRWWTRWQLRHITIEQKQHCRDWITKNVHSLVTTRTRGCEK